MNIVLLDLFSGVGGFTLGFKQAGFNITHHYFSEIDKKAISVYRKQFREAKYAGSVVDVSGTEIRKRHPNARIIICFGWPCQDNSIAGKRKGHTEGTRSNLLNEAVRIIQEVQPDYFVAENVKGLYSVNEGIDFVQSIRILTYLHSDSPQYNVEQQLLNTSWIIPQNRERTYFVGHARKGSSKQILPIRNSDLKDLQEEARRRVGVNTEEHGVLHYNGKLIQTNQSTCIDSNYWKGLDNHGQRTHVQSLNGSEINPTIRNGGRGSKTTKHNWDLVEVGTWRTHKYGEGFRKVSDGNCPTIPARAREDGSGQPVVEYKRTPLKFLDRNQKETDGKHAFTIDSCNTGGIEEIIKNEMPVCNTISPDAYITTGKRKRDEDGNAKLTSMHESRIRRLTETECELLQGFPKGWTEYGIDHNDQEVEISATQRYKQMGNAVSPPIVRLVATKIKQAIQDEQH